MPYINAPRALADLTAEQRRLVARQEARALRHLVRAHGRIPTCAPLGATLIGLAELRGAA